MNSSRTRVLSPVANGQSWLTLCLSFIVLALPWDAPAADPPPRSSVWVDVNFGEPASYEEVLEDLSSARVIYLGERHRLERHHDLQGKIITDLAAKGTKLVLGLEQLEASQQKAVDQFNRKELDFDALAKAIRWAERWDNYRQYRPALEAARKANAPVLALNARPEVIRQVARGGGVDHLPAEMRKELPADMQLKDPVYERLLSAELKMHMAATPERLRPMIEAQISRDEAMAATLAAFLNSDQGRGRTAVVLCGAGHAMFGLATVDRVRRRLPGVCDRIILFSDSGDTQLSEAEKAASRPIETPRENRREINRPIADYLYVTTPAPVPPQTKSQ
jgi:uncharacterized iron-regulated protein